MLNVTLKIDSFHQFVQMIRTHYIYIWFVKKKRKKEKKETFKIKIVICVLQVLEAYIHYWFVTGMDASVTPIPDQPGVSLVQTTDFFYPLVDDPYLQVDYIVVDTIYFPDPDQTRIRPKKNKPIVDIF